MEREQIEKLKDGKLKDILLKRKPKGLEEKNKEVDDKGLSLFFIKKGLFILVPKYKQTEEYREFKLSQLEKKQKPTYMPDQSAQRKIDINILQKMYSSKKTFKQMAERFDVGISTIHDYIKSNELKR